MVIRAITLCLAPLAFPIASSSMVPLGAPVPFVGCPSDGQGGPFPAPRGIIPVTQLGSETASKLAFYAAKNGDGVLAPRGWYCFGTYGSNGSSLYVSPTPIRTKDFFSKGSKWQGLTGPGIQFSYSDGETSGRFEMAAITARVFPKHRGFVDNLIADAPGAATDYVFAPWPADKLSYKSDELVEFMTPGGEDGLGTTSWLKKSSDPVYGMVFFENRSELGLYHLSVRLPSEMSNLATVILGETEWNLHRLPL